MTAPVDSILATTKKALGIQDDYTEFDVDITNHINSVFSTLTQLGIGPDDGYEISTSTSVWNDFITDKKWLNVVRSYMYLRVRLLFDPPATSFALDSLNAQRLEAEWRLSLYSPPAVYVTDPIVGPVAGTPSIWDLTGLIDFPPEASTGAVGIDLVSGEIFRKV